MPRTAAAILLGLTATAMPVGIATPGCGSDVETQDSGKGGRGTGGTGEMSSAAAYGVGGTLSVGPGTGGEGGISASTGDGGSGGVAPAYGVSLTDADRDGYVDAKAGGDDCNDMDASVHPGAPDQPGDGVDSNCDGDD